MTLQEVPTEILTESLLALADLRRKYKGEPMVTAYAGDGGVSTRRGCPLCLFVVAVNGYTGTGELGYSKCFPCPCLTVEGLGDESVYACCEGDFDEYPIPSRLARIDRWETAINAEIAGRAA